MSRFQFVSKIVEGDNLAAVDTILRDNLLPRSAEGFARRKVVNRNAFWQKGQISRDWNGKIRADSTTIQRLERADSIVAAPTGKNVALIGSGPSSLACAGDLVRRAFRNSF
jgi:hypothetical protein